MTHPTDSDEPSLLIEMPDREITFTSPIQRAALEQTETASPPAATAPAQSAPSGAAPALSDQELDTLARQVYAEIRQKLSIERERSRGWM